MTPQPISLLSSAGALLILTEIPHFHMLPGVILWGDRVFALSDRGKLPSYREVFAYTLPPDPTPGDPAP